MRTTLTIDDDVVRVLKQRCRQQGLSWKEVVNQTLRQGLASKPEQSKPRAYSTPPHDAGEPRLIGVHSVHDLLTFAEGEAYR